MKAQVSYPGEAAGYLAFLLIFGTLIIVSVVIIGLIERFLDWWWERKNRRKH